MAQNGLESFEKFILSRSPSVSYIIAKGDRVEREFFGGFSLILPQKIETTHSTLYDLASLTKPFVTNLVALKAYSEGFFDINEPVTKGNNSFSSLDLLRHEAGFPSWFPLYKFSSKEEVKDFLYNKIERKKAKEEAIYSCLGYICLGFFLEEKLGDTLDNLFYRFVLKPLSIEKEALFNPPFSIRNLVSGTELDGSYEREMALGEGCDKFPYIPDGGLWGVVNDGNARFLGGVAGNSGLFATIRGSFEISKCFLPSSSFLEKKVLKLCYERGLATRGENRSAGFKIASFSDSLGKELKEGSIFHEGFTGTFIAIGDREEIMILLTNRIHPKHPKKPFTPERAEFIRFCRKILNV